MKIENNNSTQNCRQTSAIVNGKKYVFVYILPETCDDSFLISRKSIKSSCRASHISRQEKLSSTTVQITKYAALVLLCDFEQNAT